MAAPRISGNPFGFLGATVAGGVSGMLFSFALAHPLAGHALLNAYMTSIPLLLAFVPLFLTGLGVGALAALAAVVTAVAGLFATMPSNVAVLYTFLFGVPALGLLALALRYRRGDDGQIYWYPESFLLAAMASYPCVIFLIMTGLTVSHEGGLLALTTDAFADMAKQLATNARSDVAQAVQDAVPQAARVAPSILGWGWVCLIGSALFLAQVVLRKMGRSLRPAFSFRDLTVPRWVFIAMAAAWVVALAAPSYVDYIGNNLGMMLSLPYFFTGLATIHVLAAMTKAPMFLLVVFYLLLSVIAWVAVPVTLLGIADQWMHIRQRWNPITKGAKQ